MICRQKFVFNKNPVNIALLMNNPEIPAEWLKITPEVEFTKSGYTLTLINGVIGTYYEITFAPKIEANPLQQKTINMALKILYSKIKGFVLRDENIVKNKQTLITTKTFLDCNINYIDDLYSYSNFSKTYFESLSIIHPNIEKPYVAIQAKKTPAIFIPKTNETIDLNYINHLTIEYYNDEVLYTLFFDNPALTNFNSWYVVEASP